MYTTLFLTTWLTLRSLFQQTGEYATDEEEAGTTVTGGEKSIEVFDLPETEDILSPSELDATKLYQKFREVKSTTRVQFLLPDVKIRELFTSTFFSASV